MNGQHPAPAVIVIMGVSGSGKTTIANELARQLGWEFQDADWFHPPANVEKMHSGVPLTDEDRSPWLRAIARWIDETRGAGRHGVVTCSALKRRYRAVLIGDRADVRLVYLKGDASLIARRIATRHEHFMPASLLASQFDHCLDRAEPARDRRAHHRGAWLAHEQYADALTQICQGAELVDFSIAI
jgi:carbohydrate kinase (thermoresistant glucokinase family)